MTWLLLIKLLIEFGPTIVALIRLIIDLIRKLPEQEQPAAKGELHGAIKQMQLEKKLQKKTGLAKAGAPLEQPLLVLKTKLEKKVG